MAPASAPRRCFCRRTAEGALGTLGRQALHAHILSVKASQQAANSCGSNWNCDTTLLVRVQALAGWSGRSWRKKRRRAISKDLPTPGFSTVHWYRDQPRYRVHLMLFPFRSPDSNRVCCGCDKELVPSAQGKRRRHSPAAPAGAHRQMEGAKNGPDCCTAHFVGRTRSHPVLRRNQAVPDAGNRRKNRRRRSAGREHGDRDAAHRLVTSHLRLVAKIAMGDRGHGWLISEVISEGNVGLDAGGQTLRARQGF